MAPFLERLSGVSKGGALRVRSIHLKEVNSRTSGAPPGKWNRLLVRSAPQPPNPRGPGNPISHFPFLFCQGDFPVRQDKDQLLRPPGLSWGRKVYRYTFRVGGARIGGIRQNWRGRRPRTPAGSKDLAGP